MTLQRLLLIGLTFASALTPVAAHAQLLPPVQPASPPRFTLGGAGVYAQPLSEFARNVRRGFGLDGEGTLNIDTRGILSLRAEIGYLQYSSKTEPFVLSTGVGLIDLESETKSGVMTIGAGPQLAAPLGSPIRPYIAGTVGIARFATETSINIPSDRSNSGQTETLDQQTIASDWVLSLGATGGIAFEAAALGRGVMIDLGARYHRNGQARYVSSNGVKYNGTGTPTVTATESQADFVVYRVGIVIPIR